MRLKNLFLLQIYEFFLNVSQGGGAVDSSQANGPLRWDSTSVKVQVIRCRQSSFSLELVVLTMSTAL